jgi:hypothetical protein
MELHPGGVPAALVAEIDFPLSSRIMASQLYTSGPVRGIISLTAFPATRG